MKKAITAFTGFVAATCISYGTITINLELDLLSDSGGATTDALLLLVADTEGSGFGNLAPGGIGVGDFIGDGDDLIIFRADTSLFGAGTISAAAAGLNFGDFSGFDAGDPLAFIWIDDLSLSDSSVIGGEAYGFYTDAVGIGDDFPSAPFVAPPDGNTVTMRLLTTNSQFFGPGLLDPLEGRTDLLVSTVPIPEPSTYLLMGLGGLAVVGLARRKRK